MKRKTSFLRHFAFALSTALSITVARSNAAPTTQTYSEPEGIYKIDVPADWQKKEYANTNEQGVRASSVMFAPELKDESVEPTLGIITISTTYKKPPEKLSEEGEMRMKLSLDSLKKLGEVTPTPNRIVKLKTRSGEWDALRCDVTFRPTPKAEAGQNADAAKPGAPSRGTFLITVTPRATVLISFSAPEKDEAAFQKLEAMVATLDLNRTETTNLLDAPPLQPNDAQAGAAGANGAGNGIPAGDVPKGIDEDLKAVFAEGDEISEEMQTLLNRGVEPETKINVSGLPETPENTQPKPAPPERITPANAQKIFDETQALLKAAKPASRERAQAARRAAISATLLAWEAFDKKDYQTSFKWLDQSSAMKKEAYNNLRGYHEAKLAQVQPRITEAQEKLKASTTPTEKSWRELYLKALSNNRVQRLDLLNSIAREHNDSKAALGFVQQLLTLRRADLAEAENTKQPEADIIEKKLTVASALENVGSIQADLSEFTASQAAYEEALSIRRALPEGTPQRELNKPLFGLARLYQTSGEFPKALDYYKQEAALFAADAGARQSLLDKANVPDIKLMMQTQNVVNEVVSLNNLGVVYSNTDNYREAINILQRALQLIDSAPPMDLFKGIVTSMRATTRGNIATAYADSGEDDKALAELQEVVRLRRANNESAAGNLHGIAVIYQRRKDYETAQRYLDQARMMYTLEQDLRGIASVVMTQASMALAQENVAGAEPHAVEALMFARQTKDYRWIAHAACSLTNVRIKQGKLEEAGTLLKEANDANAHVGSPWISCYILELEARVSEAKGENEAAAERYKKAIALLESIRSTASSESAFAEQESNYELYDRAVRLFIKMGRLDEAFDYLNRAKSKQLADSLRLSSIKTGDKALQALLDRAAGLENKLRTVENQLQAEKARPDGERDENKVKNLSLIAAATQKEFFAVSEQIKAANPNYEKVLTVKPRELKAAQRAIPQGVVFLEYAPLGDQLYIFVVTNKDLKIYTPPVKPDELWTKVKEFRTLIEAAKRRVASGEFEPVKDWMGDDPTVAPLRKNLTALYDMLIAPIEPDLKDKSTLAFIPTQLLYYLPLPSLARVDNGKLRFLVEDKQITFLSAADVLSVAQPRDESRFGTGMMAFGNPAGADLPYALEEVQSIKQVFPAAEVLSGAQATKSVLMEENNIDKRILHFATHGILNTAQPLDSYIQMAQGSTPADSELKLSEVAGLDLNKVDLVTLSACQTALGQRTPDGTEITGLANAFSVAGAQSVIASLWSVSDESTKTMMTEFYKHLAANENKSAALQKAQIALLHDPQYNHPFFWAPFILMGDWR